MFTQLFKLFKNKSTPKRSRILVIEDNPVDSKIVASILEKDGYQVLKAFDGKTGFEMTLQALPDLIILDYNLPDAIGPEVCKFIKTDPLTKHIPVLFLTWMDSPASIIDIYEHEAANYLAKPINSRTLLKEVQLALEDKDLGR